MLPGFWILWLTALVVLYFFFSIYCRSVSQTAVMKSKLHQYIKCSLQNDSYQFVDTVFWCTCIFTMYKKFFIPDSHVGSRRQEPPGPLDFVRIYLISFRPKSTCCNRRLNQGCLFLLGLVVWFLLFTLKTPEEDPELSTLHLQWLRRYVLMFLYLVLLHLTFLC